MAIVSKPGSRYSALIQLLKTSETLWNSSRVFFARWDLSASQFNVLNLIRNFPQGMTQTELSRELIVHRSNVTGLVDRLEKRGLLVRRTDPADRRVYHVVLTEAGRGLVDEILPHYYQAAEEVLSGMNERETAALVAKLKAVAENTERIAGHIAAEPTQD